LDRIYILGITAEVQSKRPLEIVGMKKDITTRSDIELLVTSFYDKVINDEVIGHIFTKLIQVNWEKHLPVMFDFWENTLFFTGSYTGNPLNTHRKLHKIFPLQRIYFERWLELFNSTINEYFEGEKAELARQRAKSIATVMRIKILEE
jgi:hemoglobin